MVFIVFLVGFVLVGSYLFYQSPALARHYGQRTANEYDFLPLNLFFLVLFMLFILVVGGLFFIFYFSAVFTIFHIIFHINEIPPHILFIPIGLTILFLEYQLLRGFWYELRTTALQRKISKDLF